MAHKNCLQKANAVTRCDCINDDIEELKALKNDDKKYLTTKKNCIAYWIADFPCESYFGTKEKCILEYLTIEELTKFIDKKCQRKKR